MPTTRIFRFFGDGSQDPYEFSPHAPVGSVHYFLWEWLHTGPETFNWSPIYEKLNAEARWLVDGEPKPVHIMLIPYISSHHAWRYFFYDATPPWLYHQGVPHTTLGGRRIGHCVPWDAAQTAWTSVPAYDRRDWREAYYSFLRAWAREFDGHPQINSVVPGVGLDGETQATKFYPMTALQRLPAFAGVEHGFGIFVQSVLEVVGGAPRMSDLAGANPPAIAKTRTFLNNAPGGRARLGRAREATARGIGLQCSGLAPGGESFQGYGLEVGTWDPMKEFYGETRPPCGAGLLGESANGMFDAEHAYWLVHFGLHFHLDFMDLHSAILPRMRPEWLDFLHTHLGVTVENTPSAWAVMRDLEFPRISWGSGGRDGYSDVTGNFEFYLKVESAGERVWRKDLPPLSVETRAHIFSRQCRSAREPVVLRLHPDFARRAKTFRVSVELLLMRGNAFCSDGHVSWLLPCPEEGEWTTAQTVVGQNWHEEQPSGPTISIQGDDVYVHKVTVTPINEPCPPDPDPDPDPPDPDPDPDPVPPYTFASKEEILRQVGQWVEFGVVSVHFEEREP